MAKNQKTPSKGVKNENQSFKQSSILVDRFFKLRNEVFSLEKKPSAYKLRSITDSEKDELDEDDFDSIISKYIPTVNPLYMTIESYYIVNHLQQKTFDFNLISLNKIAYKTKSKEQETPPQLMLLQKEAKNVLKGAEAEVSEIDVGSEFAKHMAALNYSEVISTELKTIGEELKEDSFDVGKIKHVLVSIKDKIKNFFLGIPGNIRNTLRSLYDSTKEMLDSLSLGTAVKDTLVLLLKKIVDFLFQLMSDIIGAFFSMLALVQRIAEKNGFKIDKINLEIEAFELSVYMVGPVPLVYPKLKTPKLSMDLTKSTISVQ
jgi:hypothetical protein